MEPNASLGTFLHAPGFTPGVRTSYSRGMVTIPRVKLGGISPPVGDGHFSIESSGQMNSSKIDRIRSRPLLLILLFLAAICWSTIFGLASGWLMRTQGLYSYLIYLSQIFSFPFSMTCVVWLASRSGGTGRATWIVPLILLAAEFLVGTMAGFIISIIETGGFPKIDGNDVLLY